MTITFLADAESGGAKLGNYLRRQGISLSCIRALKYCEKGIAVNGQRARTNLVLAAGDVVELELCEEAGFSAQPEELPISILFENRDAMVLDKPPGQATHPGPSHRGGTLANAYCGLAARRGYGGQFRPVGRLDVDTSGVVLCAMNAAAAPVLARSLQKGYVALAGGRLPLGPAHIDAPLAALPGSAVKQYVHPQGRPSFTEYEVLMANENASLVYVRPQTGRTHQIRAHFAHLGHPLLGDALYGGDTSAMARQALHCRDVRFCGIDGEWLECSAPLPADMREALARQGLDFTDCSHACGTLGNGQAGPGCQTGPRKV